MIAFLRKNSVEIRHRLAKEGLTLCKCSEFNGAEWLDYSPDCYFEIHGVGYRSGEYPNEEWNYKNVFLKEMEEKRAKGDEVHDFGEDVDGFVEFCKKHKADNKD